MAERKLRDVLRVTRALGDAQRARILMLLEKQELCVCQIVEVLNLAPSTVSSHLALLRAAGLVDFRKQGRWAFYFMDEDEAEPVAREGVRWMRKALAEDETMADDRKKLALVLKTDPEVLCRRQRKK